MTAVVETSESSRDGPLLAGSIAVVAWGFGPLIVRGISASSTSIIVFRVGFAVPVMIAAAYLLGGRITWPVIRQACVPGVLFFGSIVTSFASYQHTSIALATLIPAVQPALVLFLAPRVFGERSSRRQIYCAVCALLGVGGVVLAAGRSSGAHMTGNLLAVANLLLWTVYFVQVKRVRATGVHSWSFLAAVFTVCAVFAVPYGLIASNDLGAVGGRDWILISLIILGPGLVGHGLMTWAQRHLDITVASLMTLGNPVISATGAWLIFGEGLRPLQLLFAMVVLGAITGIVVDARAGAVAETGLSGPAE